MPSVFLSPSTQDWNPYLSGRTEEQYMNLVCDQVIPYLFSSGIDYARNDPDGTAGDAIRQANAGNYGLYVAIHSNAAPEGQAGSQRGSDVYYYRYGANSRRAAQIFRKNLQQIYPLPEKVRILPTTALGEVAQSKAPAVLLELAYHDNAQDEAWIKGSIPQIAWAIALSIAQYFGLPLAQPQAPQQARVTMRYGTLNLRAAPSLSARVLASIPNGEAVTVLGTLESWYVVRYGSLTGYVSAQYVTLR